MQTVVVNIKKEHFDIYIGRQYSPLEFRVLLNPFGKILLEAFNSLLPANSIPHTERVAKVSIFPSTGALKGKRLGCFCKPKACHGDVIADWLNKMEEKA